LLKAVKILKILWRICYD